MHDTSGDNGQGQSSAELFPTIHYGENPDAIQHKTHVEPFIFSTSVGENLDESFSHSNLMVVDHKHFRWKRLARQGTVNPSGIVLDGSSLGKRVQDALSHDLLLVVTLSGSPRLWETYPVSIMKLHSSDWNASLVADSFHQDDQKDILSLPCS
ncbi:hypothetical protein ACOSQ3_032367 [Xanthoceras sorbifolium]